MFKMGNNNNTPPPADLRPSAESVARLSGNYTQVIVSPDKSDGVHVFVNGEAILPGSLESVGINIIAPGDNDSGTITGVLSRYEGSEEARSLKSTSLFPGTVDILAYGRRLVVSGAEQGSFEGLYLRVGSADGGIGTDVLGVQSLEVVISGTLTSARLTWAEGGTTEDILPEG